MRSSLRPAAFLLIGMMVMVFTSCEHKELCYAHPHTTKIKVVYDWSYAPDANPAGMCVFFYSKERAGEYHRFDFSNTKGGEIELPEGKYEVITYNNDTEAVQFTSLADFRAHKAFTRTGDILEPMFGNGVTSSVTTDNGERVVISPDNLWGCSASDVEISDTGVKYTITHSTRADGDATVTSTGDEKIITLYPSDELCHYSYEVRNVTNARHISRISGAISGMSGAMSMADNSLDTETVTIPFSGTVNAADSKVTGAFLTFGQNPDSKVRHLMSFYVVMDDGGKYSYKGAPNLDVTQQVDTASNRRRVHIIIDGLDLPTPIQDGEGFQPTVDDWTVNEEDINI